jgi:hypothetical protein
VTFKDKASAEAFMALESVKSPEDTDIIRKWQADYFDEKQKEFEEKKSKKNTEKKAKAQIVEEQGKLDDEAAAEAVEAMPKGAVLFMEGLKDDTMREDIKSALKSGFEVGLTIFRHLYTV